MTYFDFCTAMILMERRVKKTNSRIKSTSLLEVGLTVKNSCKESSLKDNFMLVNLKFG